MLVKSVRGTRSSGRPYSISAQNRQFSAIHRNSVTGHHPVLAPRQVCNRLTKWADTLFKNNIYCTILTRLYHRLGLLGMWPVYSAFSQFFLYRSFVLVLPAESGCQRPASHWSAMANRIKCWIRRRWDQGMTSWRRRQDVEFLAGEARGLQGPASQGPRRPLHELNRPLNTLLHI